MFLRSPSTTNQPDASLWPLKWLLRGTSKEGTKFLHYDTLFVIWIVCGVVFCYLHTSKNRAISDFASILCSVWLLALIAFCFSEVVIWLLSELFTHASWMMKNGMV